MTIEDIDKNEVERVRETFEKDARIRDLRIQAANLQKNHLYIEALKMNKYIDTLFQNVLQTLVDERNEELKKTIPLSDTGLSPEDIHLINVNIIAVYLMVDAIDTAIMSANEILLNKAPEYEIASFSDITELGKKAKQKIEYLQKNTEYMNDFAFADTSDNIYKLVYNKAKSILMKRASSDWGKNLISFKSKSDKLDEEYKEKHNIKDK